MAESSWTTAAAALKSSEPSVSAAIPAGQNPSLYVGGEFSAVTQMTHNPLGVV
jgi:hypothetical protein